MDLQANQRAFEQSQMPWNAPAFMNESGMLFWSMSGIRTVPQKKPRGNANAYLGPESRKYFRVLMDFVKDLCV